jgi:alkylated DNA nucleotide flippase Atl1
VLPFLVAIHVPLLNSVPQILVLLALHSVELKHVEQYGTLALMAGTEATKSVVLIMEDVAEPQFVKTINV